MKRYLRASWLMLGIAILSLGALFSRGQPTGASTDVVLQGLENQIDAFLNSLSDGQIDDGFDTLLLDSPQLKRSSSITELRERTGELDQRFGKYRGHEQVASRRIGQD